MAGNAGNTLIELKQLFRKYDSCSSGVIGKEELTAILLAVSGMSRRNLDLLLHQVDPGNAGSGVVKYDLFLSFILVGCWQVQTENGWHFFDDASQAALRAASERGAECCEIFAEEQGQYYIVDLSRLVQINPATGNERNVRQVGAPPPKPEVPRLAFSRLLADFRELEQAARTGEGVRGLLRCAPVETNLMEWDVALCFDEDSRLQLSLEALAAATLDRSFKYMLLRLRFPVEYPRTPPEVWLRQPRVRHPCGPVSFGGRIQCSLLSSGWKEETRIVALVKHVRQLLLDSVEAVPAVSSKKEYPGCPPQMRRLQTELFPTANGFCQDSIAMSPMEATPFLGDLSHLEMTDKICLSQSDAGTIYQRAELGAELELPLVFEVSTASGRKRHCAIFESIEGLPDKHVLMPKWVMNDLSIQERDSVRIRCVSLDLITAVTVQPHSTDFYTAVSSSGCEVNDLLTKSLSRFSALTEDTAVPIEICGALYGVQILQCQPRGAVRIIDMDMAHHFEFKVDFQPSPDLEDEAVVEEYRSRVLAEQQALTEWRLEARRRRFQLLHEKAREEAADQSCQGTVVEVSLRMPDGSKVKAEVREGEPIGVLTLLALRSEWAAISLPWGIELCTAFPRKILKGEDPVTKELHRSTVHIQEEDAPECDAELSASLGGDLRNPGMGPAVAAWEVQPIDEDLLLERTQQAFEKQRFLSAGFSKEEAEEKCAAGETLPACFVRTALRAEVPQPAAGISPEEQESRVQDVVNFSGVDSQKARQALEDNDWATDAAVNALLDEA